MKSWFFNTFPDYKKLPKSGKIYGMVDFCAGRDLGSSGRSSGCAGTDQQHGMVCAVWSFIFVLGVLALSAAWNAFKYRAVGFKRMTYVYIPCILQIAFASDVFSFVFYIDSVLKLSFSLTINKLTVGVNFAAILFIVLAGRNYRHLKMVSQNTDKNVEPLEQGQETQS